MNPVEIVVGLVLAAVALSTIAQRLQIPYPPLLVLGGLALGFIPGLPRIQIPPEVAFPVFVPPLVYLVAAQVGLRDLRANIWPILRLSIGLVLLNLVCIATAAHFSVEGLSWSAAFVLAAIVSPTDTAAVAAVTGRLPIPQRVARILEGESLFNDMVALVAYQQAVHVTVTGTFSLGDLGLEFVWDVIGGVGWGLAVGAISTWARRQVEETAANTAISLLTPFTAFLGAEVIQGSGVLATVAAGLYIGRYLLPALTPDERLQAFSFWIGVRFVLEGLAFVLIGLQLRLVLTEVGRLPILELLTYCAIIGGTTILLRIVWVFLWKDLPRLAFRYQSLPWQQTVLIAWGGMRGVDSLAAALALPLVLADRVTPFPERSMILFLSFSVILVTLILQGLSMPALIRFLAFPPDSAVRRQELQLRLAACRAASRRLEELSLNTTLPASTIDHFRTLYQNRIRQYESHLAPTDQESVDTSVETTRGLMRELLQAERQVVTAAKSDGGISDEAIRRFERSLDYEELNLSFEADRTPRDR